MYRIRQALTRFMAGRRGMDELGIALYAVGFALYIIALFFGSTVVGSILRWLYMILWIYGIFRMLSRNLYKRAKENEKFLGFYRPFRTSLMQAKTRFKNRKIYKYYRCPKCKSWLKLPRHVGEKTVTCGKCGETFKKKA